MLGKQKFRQKVNLNLNRNASQDERKQISSASFTESATSKRGIQRSIGAEREAAAAEAAEAAQSAECSAYNLKLLMRLVWQSWTNETERNEQETGVSS